MQRTCLSGSPESQFCFWLMIVSIAIVVLPVGRSPMISWRWPRPIGVSESIALMPVASGSWTDLRCITPGAWSSSGAAGVGLDLAEAVDRGAERVDDAAEEVVADGDGEDLAGAADRLALLDPVEVTEDDDADLAGVEVQGEAERAVLELEQLVGHGRGQAGDPGDAVAGLGDGADLFLAGRLRLVVGDVLLERVADLLRTDRELRHLRPCSLLSLSLWLAVSWSWVSRRGAGGRRRAGWRWCRR